MTAQPIKLTDTQSAALKKLVSAGSTAIASLIAKLDGGGDFVRPSKLRATLQSVFPEEKTARQIDNLLTQLESRQRQFQVDAKEFLDRVELSLRQGEKAWDGADISAWSGIKPELERLLTTRSVVLKSKAVDLSYDFERVHGSSRIITDVRPIFDENRAEIIGDRVP